MNGHVLVIDRRRAGGMQPPARRSSGISRYLTSAAKPRPTISLLETTWPTRSTTSPMAPWHASSPAPRTHPQPIRAPVRPL